MNSMRLPDKYAEVRILALRHADANLMSAAFTDLDEHRPASQFLLYLAEQASGRRVVLIASLAGAFVGYTTLVWQSPYGFFRERGIPEIQDLNVLPPYRRRGIATRLMDAAEHLARFQPQKVIGLSVGLHAGYAAAHRLYALRGYVPDGQGLTYDGRYVAEGQQVTLDDRLALHLTKRLSPSEPR
jgi:GNAT superfamily N-acetyltransferase